MPSVNPEPTARANTYRVIILNSDGSVLETRHLLALSDIEAISSAHVMLEDHDLELWHGSRLIEHFDGGSV